MEYPPMPDSQISKEQKNRKLLNRTLGYFLVFLLGFLSYWVGFQNGKAGQSTSSGPLPFSITSLQDTEHKDLDFSLFWKVWDTLKDKYVDTDKLDAQKLMYGAIKGMLAATGDPYTNFFDPEENKRFREDIEGVFEGIGAEMGIKNGILTVVAPLADSPAEKAGLKAGDKILKIDDQITESLSIDEAVKRIRGQKNTEVRLTIFREGEENTREVTVTRGVISVKSVTLEMKEGGVAYLKITRFGDDTEQEFYRAVSSIKNKQSKGLVLDLRNNPGGYLDAAVQLAGRMLPEKDVIVIEEDSKNVQEKISAEGGDVLSSVPTIVLINEGSASASEILAGALRDNRENVTLVGKKSFGKGSVQEFLDLPQGTAIKVTVAKWLTPKGNQINEVGISPDVEVEMTNEDFDNDRDPQLDRALELIKEKI